MHLQRLNTKSKYFQTVRDMKRRVEEENELLLHCRLSKDIDLKSTLINLKAVNINN